MADELLTFLAGLALGESLRWARRVLLALRRRRLDVRLTIGFVEGAGEVARHLVAGRAAPPSATRPTPARRRAARGATPGAPAPTPPAGSVAGQRGGGGEEAA